MLMLMFVDSPFLRENGEFLGYASMIIAFSTIFVATKTHRDKNLDGTISFKKAFLLGLGITMIASVLYIIAWLFISNTQAAQDMMNQYVQMQITQVKSSNLPQAEIDQALKEISQFVELYQNPLFKIGMTFVEIFPVGLTVSLISALILKRQKTN